MLIPLLAVMIHEAGHLAAVFLLGGKVRNIEFRLSGAKISYFSALSYKYDTIISMAGPAANLIGFAVGIFSEKWYFAGLNIALCIFNLLPALPLDGGNALYSVISKAKDPFSASKALNATTSASAGIFLTLIAVTAVMGRVNVFFVLPAVLLLKNTTLKNTLQKMIKKVKWSE